MRGNKGLPSAATSVESPAGLVARLSESRAARLLLAAVGIDDPRKLEHIGGRRLLEIVFKSRRKLALERDAGTRGHWTYDRARHGQRLGAFGLIVRLALVRRQSHRNASDR